MKENVRLANGFIHIGAYDDIVIEKNVLIAAFTQIINGNHEYKFKDKPIMYQGSFGTGKIVIGEGSWIGRNACILGGVKLGKNCVVGANSVVTKSFESYSVIVGSPAKQIKNLKS
ncbi:acyltransferase [Hippea jasoniae]|uniref:acyltransferase n=1 Tax=Hippea jasoniae TaxID=944479 RepID=UPI0018DB3873|nr:acyltransferase [Hippea jasoniae]